MKSSAILFINGEIDIAFCERYIKSHFDNYPVFCADGAYNSVRLSCHLYQKLVSVIGDGDSIDVIKTSNHIDYILAEDQEYTDFEKSLLHLLQMGIKRLVIFGFGGKEMDHYLGNVSTALAFKDEIDFMFIDQHGQSVFLSPEFRLENVKNKMVSVLPLPVLKGISYHGLKYPLDKATLTLGRRVGTRNQATSDVIEIHYDSGDGLVFISHENYRGKNE
ncbi:MAG: thiamine diphosphokinase [Francisellaceae bacterium]